MNTAQDFVDQLNHREFPALGYTLERQGDLLFWVYYPPPALNVAPTKVPANQFTRESLTH